jgi:hypothetical protein
MLQLYHSAVVISDGFALLPGSGRDTYRKSFDFEAGEVEYLAGATYDLDLVERAVVVAVKHHALVEILAHDLTYDARFSGP